jgi:hypothetical protein
MKNISFTHVCNVTNSIPMQQIHFENHIFNCVIEDRE